MKEARAVSETMELLKRVVEELAQNGANGEISLQLYNDIRQHVDGRPQDGDLPKDVAEDFRTRAREEWEREGEIEIDDEAVISHGDDDGAYVQAWVWVDDAHDDEERPNGGVPIDFHE